MCGISNVMDGTEEYLLCINDNKPIDSLGTELHPYDALLNNESGDVFDLDNKCEDFT